MVTFPAVAVKIEETFRQSVVIIKKITGMRASREMLAPEKVVSEVAPVVKDPSHSHKRNHKLGSLGRVSVAFERVCSLWDRFARGDCPACMFLSAGARFFPDCS